MNVNTWRVFDVFSSERLESFRQVRDAIEAQLKTWLTTPSGLNTLKMML